MDVKDMDASVKPPTGRRMKARAPPPPGPPQPAPRKIFSTPRNVVPDGGGQGGGTKENMVYPMVDFRISLPGGFQTDGTVDGSKALMDLLVDLCGRYHLNPAHHTLELLSPAGQPVPFKPNALLGMLDVRYVLIKEKVPEGRVIRKPLPRVPEKTVRLVLNFHKKQKAVLRVNPQVPLGSLVPVICDKCDFDPDHVILLKDNISNHEMDLDKSLAELGVRELYVLDQKLVLPSKMSSAPVLNYSESIHSDNLSDDGEEKKGLLGFLKFKRRKSKNASPAPPPPCVEVRPNTLGQSQSVMNVSRTSPKTDVKKRRAPPPPQATPTPSTLQCLVETYEVRSSSPNSSQQKKRKAPAPPLTPGPQAEDSTSHSIVCSSSGGDGSTGSSTSTGSIGSSLGAVDSAPCGQEEEPDVVLDATPEATESPLNERMEEPENIRHSATSAERQVPLKPRRIPTREPPTLTIPPPPPDTPPPAQQDSHDAPLEHHAEAAPQPWLRTLQDEEPGLAPELEPETVSVASSSDGSSSLPDQGYAPSEGMPEEAYVSSPSEVARPTSPSSGVSPDNQPGHTRIPPRDSSSDSDEGCATWGSRHRHSNEIHPGEQSSRNKDTYEDDLEITAQLHETLAELDAGLADVDHIDEASICESSTSDKSLDGVPVSFLDLEVPVTTINEVVDNLEPSTANYEVSSLSRMQNVIIGNHIPIYKPHGGVRVKDDSAFTKCGDSPGFPHAALGDRMPEERLNNSSRREEEVKDKTTAIPVTEIQDGAWKEDSHIETAVFASSAQDMTGKSSRDQRCLAATKGQTSQPPKETEATVPMKRQMAQNTITPNPSSRYGLKTFTVVPPKPTMTQNSAGSLVIGAIKIDALGNMVLQDNKHRRSLRPEGGTEVGKAKAFSTSTKQQDTVPCNRDVSNKTKDLQISKPAPAETLKTTVDGTQSKSLFTDPKEPFVKPMHESDQKRDLSFLKPSRRTSSQYVASAISKYTRGPSTGTKRSLELNAAADLSVSKQEFSGTKNFSNSSRFEEMHSNNSTHIADSECVLDVKGISGSVPVTNPKCSASFQEHTNYKVENTRANQDENNSLPEEGGKNTAKANSRNESCTTVPRHQSITSTQQRKSPAKPELAISQSVYSSVPAQDAMDADSLVLDRKSDSPPSTGASTEGCQPGVFGPVTKFKPVIMKAIQKETSLHSTLMEAIQSGDGKDRLRKVSGAAQESSSTSLSFVTTENEHCALLAAIRAQNNSTRLRKTKSEAASELEGYRKAELGGTALPEPLPPPPAFAPPPPPVPYVPSMVSSARNPPEGAREALLEAIRSGFGAQKLKKVPVPTKTVLVNGRLGKIRASSSVLQGHEKTSESRLQHLHKPFHRTTTGQ
ncbi:LOW QUALITY PROTEIN: protein cordon-bleu [Brienomyrus brachyistius]|uniref:LOW QUALITY PROTEIN: protein cordon-bleu n=1 Tax=Brienomyrus brachyistius TaxID=42636 RepID=UPI0020B3CB16|nr:LOW QUALITY PROTEIN: protein cordon-bleu [Brienomyrus brachyistius]